MYELYLHPGSFSGWSVELMLRELDIPYTVHHVDLFKGEQFKQEFLRLSPRGTVPVLVTDSGTKLTAIGQIRTFLKESFSNHPVFQGETESFLRKLDEAPVGFVTYGLAFHQEYTKVLRYPFHEPDFFDKSREYIMERGNRMQEAIANCHDPEVTEQLIAATEDHYTNAEHYLNADKYSSALQTVASLLDWFEGELGKEKRTGIWLGGIHCNVADLTLGLLLHRLWQLGFEKEMFEEGVRPHLAIYFHRIRNRPSLKIVTKWYSEDKKRIIKTDEDVFADNAKIGLGVMAVLGGLFLGKKFLKK